MQGATTSTLKRERTKDYGKVREEIEGLYIKGVPIHMRLMRGRRNGRENRDSKEKGIYIYICISTIHMYYTYMCILYTYVSLRLSANNLRQSRKTRDWNTLGGHKAKGVYHFYFCFVFIFHFVYFLFFFYLFYFLVVFAHTQRIVRRRWSERYGMLVNHQQKRWWWRRVVRQKTHK